ncbi:hypothetical protein [Flavobacterium sp. I3-2]|uniref:hypothetical protein n=1 Tax=Flavobacterium sp. I3-2 TaxID=2748319 RepID=UPI0015AC86D8|nr:hypothetical protein [Flavobacterium sp. I3-2]
MRKLILLFLVCNTLWSCKTKQIIGSESTSEIIINPYFNNPDIDYVYKAKINAFSKEFTGLFIAKKIDKTSHRVVLSSDFGNTLIDFTISENDFKVNYVLDDLNKKLLIKTLESDFRILLKSNIQSNSKSISNSEIQYFAKSQKNNLEYSYKIMDNELFQIKKLKRHKEIVTFDFNEITNDYCSKITISHKNWPITIQLIKQ